MRRAQKQLEIVAIPLDEVIMRGYYYGGQWYSDETMAEHLDESSDASQATLRALKREVEELTQRLAYGAHCPYTMAEVVGRLADIAFLLINDRLEVQGEEE